VKDRIVEDVELMRALKKEGFKTRFLAGRHLASTRMHTHLGQMFHGWARIFAGTSRGRVVPMLLTILFLIGCLLSVYPAIVYGLLTHNMWWWMTGLIHWSVMTGLMGLVWFWSGNSPVWALCLPVSVPIQILILLFSVQKAWKGVIDWRGIPIDLRTTSRVIESNANQGKGN
jgi:chlorobactene glucosyltransferase